MIVLGNVLRLSPDARNVLRMTTSRTASRQIRLGNTAKGGTMLISVKPSTKAAYVAQLRSMVAANPTATHLQFALANAERA